MNEFLTNLQTTAYKQDDETLHTAFEIIRSALKRNQALKTITFIVGQRVKVNGRRSAFEGTILKVNRQSVSVKANDTGMIWKVSPGFLAAA